MIKKPRPPKRADGTLNALCKTLNLGKRRVSELLKQSMPDDPQAALAWRRAREDDDTAAALRKERIGLVRAQRLAAELANQRAACELVPRSEVLADSVRIASAMQAFLRKIEKDLPQLCLGLTLSQSAPLVKARIREIQQAFSDMSEEFWNNEKSK